MVGKLAPKSNQFTRVLVKYIPWMGCFRAVLSQNGDKFATPPTPPIVERLNLERSRTGPDIPPSSKNNARRKSKTTKYRESAETVSQIGDLALIKR